MKVLSPGQVGQSTDDGLDQQLPLPADACFDLLLNLVGNFHSIGFDLGEPPAAWPGDKGRIPVQKIEHLGHIGIEKNGCFHVLVDFRRIDLDVDHLGITGEIVQIAGDPVIEAHAQGNNQIGIHQGPVGFHGPVHTHHAQAHRVVHWQRRQSMQGKGHRDMGLLRKSLQFLPGVAGNDAVAAEDDGTLAPVDQIDGRFQRVPIHRG
jgi:hypothetical protein